MGCNIRWPAESPLHPRPLGTIAHPTPPTPGSFPKESLELAPLERVPKSSPLAAHLARHAAVVGAALPEAPAVPGDVPDHLVLVREIHLPDEGAVAKDPHVSRPVALSSALPGIGRQGAAPGAAAAAAGALHPAPALLQQGTLGLVVITRSGPGGGGNVRLPPAPNPTWARPPVARR